MPFGKFATDASEFSGYTATGIGYRQSPAVDTLDSIPRSTWIDDMEKDWLHHTFPTRQQQQQQQRQPLLADVVGQRVVFGEPFPAYFEPAVASQREHDTEEDEGEQNSIEFDELDDGGRRRRPSSSRGVTGPHRCPGNVWQQEFMFEDRAASRWTVPRKRSVYRSTTDGFRGTFNQSSSNEEFQQRQSQTVYLRILYRTMTSYVVYELIYTM
uniref:Uncharacterized protein n=1 Tax=Anopheles atroparvus TaxID=41427 RepID=A0AAG5DEU3_ANOAO